ncbi:SDR family NAD(P)-dependent oxidoreductase [Ferruginibacter albus]|uniref:SDR family NAD(P)-dependent oxidoreductase n=1 Tax=Ferruginibacter albus TaxID=2875540 RepID=UPI001CC3D268|nr:SDR family NAD(P)-dependent oxidoreductase [Ferruginibacter albus]UAY52891.1 SDR family NAD(P)-dependent oxidoreductase [Ferruginibacter albus]
MKKAIIIGATSGIGRELAIILADNNYVVGITGRRKQLLDELKDTRPDHFIVSAFDVTETLAVTKKLDELAADLGKVDLVILSSGTGELNEQLDLAIEKETLDVNVTGFTAIANWTIKYFLQQKQGQFAAITSIAGLRGSRHAPAYNATKAFQINYLEGLRQKIKRSKLPITITDIRPGFVDTAMAKGEGKFWVAPVTKASKQILNAIENRKRIVYVTKRWRIIAFVLRLIPTGLYSKM